MPRLPLHALQVFATVARSDSFRSAADELCVSQSAVSHQIKHLEDWFGRPLFDRNAHRPRLMPHGETLARALNVSFTDIEMACRCAQEGADRRTLVIATIPSIATCWLIPRLSGFTADHPGIDIRVTYAFHGQPVDFGKIDLAFVYSRALPERPGTRALPILSGTSAPVCSPSARTTAQVPDEAGEVLRIGLLHDTDVGAWTEWFPLAGRNPPDPMSGPVFEDFNLLRAAALAGQGVALCPLALIGDDLASGRLVQLSDVTVNHDLDYYLIVRNTCDGATAKASEEFTRWLRDAGANGDEPFAIASGHSATCRRRSGVPDRRGTR